MDDRDDSSSVEDASTWVELRGILHLPKAGGCGAPGARSETTTSGQAVVSQKCVDRKQRALASVLSLVMASERTHLLTIKRLLNQVELALASPNLPTHPIAHCRELLCAAQGLTNDLLTQTKLPAAAVLGHKGGTQTAKRGSEYFRELAAKRKNYAGGRPRKSE